MGLDAVVFRNVCSLRAKYGDDPFGVDETTGEAIVEPNVDFRIPREALFAIEVRLGNLQEIAMLREAVMRVFADRPSLIVDSVLYSGSHCGDTIVKGQLETLVAEIRELREQNRAELGEFLAALESLVTASRAERNPIVFV